MNNTIKEKQESVRVNSYLSYEKINNFLQKDYPEKYLEPVEIFQKKYYADDHNKKMDERNLDY